MTPNNAVRSLGALAQEHRLKAFRLLVQAGPEGLAAGVLAAALGVAASSMSFHLAQLLHAGLVTQQRHGRSIRYTADFDAMNGLMAFLTDNCCGGESCTKELHCAPILPNQGRAA